MNRQRPIVTVRLVGSRPLVTDPLPPREAPRESVRSRIEEMVDLGMKTPPTVPIEGLRRDRVWQLTRMLAKADRERHEAERAHREQHVADREMITSRGDRVQWCSACGPAWLNEEWERRRDAEQVD